MNLHWPYHVPVYPEVHIPFSPFGALINDSFFFSVVSLFLTSLLIAMFQLKAKCRPRVGGHFLLVLVTWNCQPHGFSFYCATNISSRWCSPCDWATLSIISDWVAHVSFFVWHLSNIVTADPKENEMCLPQDKNWARKLLNNV